MTFIVLHRPIASSSALERVHMFAGRHLGEEEFDREQDYADARLAPLLKPHAIGIVDGLNLSSDGIQNLGEHDSFVVNPGLAVTPQGQTLNLQMPLRAQWQAIINYYLDSTATDDASGVYYLILKQTRRSIDSPTVVPCQRAEFDPTRDSRLVTVTSVELKRLAIDPGLVLSTAPEQIQNWVAADRVDGAFLNGFQQAVPLALLAINTVDGDHQLVWISEAAGRYEATTHAGYRVLLNQTSLAFRSVMQSHAQTPNQATPLADFLADHLHLDYLPASGQFPTAWLQQPDAVHPNLLWLPGHVGVDMVPVPVDSVAELLNRHLARRAIDLRQASGDKIRLLLALDRKDYRPDILDIPPTDAALETDIYRFYMRAYNAWHRWRQQFDKLYYVEPSNEPALTSPSNTAIIERSVLDPKQFKHLDLPKPTLPPLTPAELFQNVINRAMTDLTRSNSTSAPYPYDKGIPAQPAFYLDWLVLVDETRVPPPIPTPDQDGLVIQYAVALVELEAIENQIRSIRTRLEKTRDFLLLQRQQLDSQTVALASLAGGVAGDGNGLQVARWLPYASLNTNLLPEELTADNPASANIVNRAVAGAEPTIAATSTGTKNFTINSNFGSNLLSSALNTSVRSTTSYINFKPQTYSAFELGINKKRLDLLANLAKSAVSKPAFEAKEFRFGVLDHISPEINEYRKAYYGMQDLLATLPDLFDATDAAALRNRLKAIMTDKALLDPVVLEKQIDDQTDDYINTNPSSNREQLRGLVANQKRYGALFIAGKVLTQWIAICEARYNQVERKLQGKLREHTRKLAQIEKLSGLIRVARETLENLDRFFDEQLGDYGVAQRLLEEDWRQVYDLNLERSRILTTAVQGLYYVRVRNTPVSIALSDPLSLRHKSASDIVPGCDGETDAELPDELESFFDAVTEIPMDDWASLKPLKPKLPPFHRFEYLGKLRATRFKSRPVRIVQSIAANSLQARLQTVQLQTQSVVKQWATLALPTFSASSVQTQQQAAKVFSLEDLILGSNSALRRQAHNLRERLEQCQACLLEKLNLLPGSIRLRWGQLAEDDRIRVEQVSWWPGLEDAEKDDFDAARTIAELIDWWFRQLADDADGASRTAMHNMIRATLIFASLGDPQEIVRGSVFTPPRLTLPGERFRVKLNRQIIPGIKLQLLDPNQQVAAELTVEDHSPDSTQVRIVKVLQPDIKINTRFTVLGNIRKQT